MERTRSPPTEILVHVSGPSKASDDGLYRDIAHAYLAFTPDRCSALPSHEAHSSQNPQHPAIVQHGEAPLAQQAAAVDYVHHPPLVAESQDLSFRSAMDNRSSPRQLLHRKLKHSAQVTPPRGSSILNCSAETDLLPPSQISDSYPMPCQTLFKVSPARIFQTLLASSRISPDGSPSPKRRRRTRPRSPIPDLEIPSSLPDPAVEVEDVGEEEGVAVPDASYVSSTPRRKIIPVTPFAVQERPRGQLHHHRRLSGLEHDGALADVTHISSSFSTPVPRASPQSTPIDTKVSASAPGSLAEALGPASSLSKRQQLSTVAPPPTTPWSSIKASILSELEIRPPSPELSINNLTPEDLIPSKLAKLSKDLASRYRPLFRRPIEPLERGYWSVDCTAWDSEARSAAWVFLAQYIASGLAGWGTWCRREDELQDRIRLYCWGCATKHAFLLLYLASERRLKGTGAAWVGADGEVAVEVAGASG